MTLQTELKEGQCEEDEEAVDHEPQGKEENPIKKDHLSGNKDVEVKLRLFPMAKEFLLTTKEPLSPNLTDTAYRRSPAEQYNVRPTLLAKVLENKLTQGAIVLALVAATAQAVRYIYHKVSEPNLKPNIAQNFLLEDAACLATCTPANLCNTSSHQCEPIQKFKVFHFEPNNTFDLGPNVQNQKNTDDGFKEIKLLAGEEYILPDGRRLNISGAPVKVQITGGEMRIIEE